MMKSRKRKAVSARLAVAARGFSKADRFKLAAFSLIEVVAAVGVFAIGLVALFGLFAPVTRSVANVSETESAAFVADAVRARLQALAATNFTAAEALLQDASGVTKNDGSGTYNSNDGKNPAVIFAKQNGEVGIYDTTQSSKTWYYFDHGTNKLQPLNNADKFFEIDLIRNATLSPKPPLDDSGNVVPTPPQPVLAYTMRVRWPAFLPGPGGTAVQVGANPSGGAVTFDQSRKQVLFFTGTIAR